MEEELSVLGFNFFVYLESMLKKGIFCYLLFNFIGFIFFYFLKVVVGIIKILIILYEFW